jgi:hypothetical protein
MRADEAGCAGDECGHRCLRPGTGVETSPEHLARPPCRVLSLFPIAPILSIYHIVAILTRCVIVRG